MRFKSCARLKVDLWIVPLGAIGGCLRQQGHCRRLVRRVAVRSSKPERGKITFGEK
jgi:hypothetical protein